MKRQVILWSTNSNKAWKTTPIDLYTTKKNFFFSLLLTHLLKCILFILMTPVTCYLVHLPVWFEHRSLHESRWYKVSRIKECTLNVFYTITDWVMIQLIEEQRLDLLRYAKFMKFFFSNPSLSHFEKKTDKVNWINKNGHGHLQR